MGEEDVELDLPWKAALDDETFADLGYATHAANSMGLDPSQRQEHTPSQRPRPGATTTQRFKRKNFSKQLQLLSLQRYAQYAKDFGRIPDKHETQQLVQQSHLQFLKEGGAPDEPRPTYEEFLKLIRNRRSEINARAQRPPKQCKDEQEVSKRAVLTPAKRKLQEERAKICEYIEIIDRTREQTGLIPDPQHQNRRLRPQLSSQTQHRTTVEMVMVPGMESLAPLTSDPMEQMEAILQIHQETREVQREIAARLRSISRIIREHEGHGDMEEPSSASV
ncbi:hypothetical protein JG687_00003880 [Phytophthora cactorum]|uniref:Uncharacterized protein n=1 Tax=Phytophthora cactorum TaxID=29920 RepID=A0A329SE57_9STRA|nr:hypothetical protein Pcac1_g7767 [Phytophthora cactorum]KAG2915128.1 hypothetical protein PC114_g7938 [Phytophthora cactorum]KAG2920769.1 hypothetical protein PC115_g9705 [Phytophthora cactorum]KAG2946158.1 hypothetical protein PC117_g7850 [Phytophthora cactorum]KAG3019288.1 hypothetical protein PC119_g10368 [Phytophthora cactorum]